eukprot:gene5889-biopygen4891
MGKGSRANRSRERDVEDDEFRTLSHTFKTVEDQPKTVIQPSKFFGERGDDVEKWLKSFERIARANGWSERRQCEILPAFLRVRAAEFFDELPEELQDDLSELKTALVEKFIPKEARRFFYADLYTRWQGESESAEDFGREIQLLVRRAYAKMPMEHQDTLMPEHFVNGLRPSLKRIVLISDPKSYAKAVAVAKREEINDQVSNGSAPWVRPHGGYQAPPQMPAAVAAVEQKYNDRLDRLENMVEKLSLALVESGRQNQAQSFGRRTYGSRTGT